MGEALKKFVLLSTERAPRTEKSPAEVESKPLDLKASGKGLQKRWEMENSSLSEARKAAGSMSKAIESHGHPPTKGFKSSRRGADSASRSPR